MTIAPDPPTSRRRALGAWAASAVIALIAAVLVAGGVKPIATAATYVFVDTPAPSAVQRADYPVSALIQRGELLGRVMTSPPVVDRIAQRMGVPAREIGTSARTTANVQAALTEPSSEQRASDIVVEGLPYRIEVQARQTTPVLDIYTHAPTAAAAARLANTAVAALQGYLAEVAAQEALPAKYTVRLRQLGPPRGGRVNGGMAAGVGVVTFLVVFGLMATALRSVAGVRRRTPRPPDGWRAAAGDWPRTTRLMPWSFALFLAVLWLVPFNDIQLSFQLPIDLKFDRLVLPFVAAAWALALMLGGRAAPRLRLSWIHVAVGAFVLCAFVSVIVNAGSLNQTLELEGSLKQLPLLVAYVSLFVIASSAVRSSEVRAFILYTLGLSAICAFGVIWEYRFKQNLFYDWSDKLLPGVFEVSRFDAGAIDDIGRRLVRGPAALPLEAVAMLAMALPIPLVLLTQTRRWGERALYGFAACLLLAAMFATFRKSALLAPMSAILTVAYFRRSELLKLSPLALVLVVVVHVLAPGALGKTTTQFDPSKLGVTTVSDRAADYDAVRPDLWSHLLVGRGWGSYDHITYRVLDSEILHRTVEMGVFGVATYLMMIVAVVLCARPVITGRDPDRAPIALMGAAAAVAFGAVSTLFDVLSFPHATYIFLYLAGLVAVVAKREHERPQPVILVPAADPSPVPHARPGPLPSLVGGDGSEILQPDVPWRRGS
jgi:hypothetical protein